jgi:hypothetical protein
MKKCQLKSRIEYRIITTFTPTTPSPFLIKKPHTLPPKIRIRSVVKLKLVSRGI